MFFTAGRVRRLYKGREDVEFEWTVGPLSTGMDVVFRVSSDIDSGETYTLPPSISVPDPKIHCAKISG